MNHQHRGQSPRGNPHKVSLIHALHIWEGQPLTQNTPSRARFDSASHRFKVFIADGFSRRVYALPLVVLAAEADVFGKAVANIQRVQCRLRQLSCLAPCATDPRCFGCFGCRLQRGVYLISTPGAEWRVSFTRSFLC